jgi:hypothetical protein
MLAVAPESQYAAELELSVVFGVMIEVAGGVVSIVNRRVNGVVVTAPSLFLPWKLAVYVPSLSGLVGE